MLVPEAIEVFLAQKSPVVAARTIAGYQKTLRKVSDLLHRRGVIHVADVTPDDLDAIMLGMAAAGLKHTTRFHHASVLREFFRILQERGLVLRNPALDLPVPDDKDGELPPAPLEEGEVAVLLAAAGCCDVIELRNRAHLHLLYGCALRLSESLALNVGDIDFGQRTVFVRAGKGNRDRFVPLMKGVAGALKDYLSLRRQLLKGPDTGVLLMNNRGNRLGEYMIRAVLDDLAVRCGFGRKLHPHLLRHSLAVHFLRGGADIREVQAFLGHSSVETTKVYLRMVPGHLRDAYDAAMPDIAVRASPRSEDW